MDERKLSVWFRAREVAFVREFPKILIDFLLVIIN